MSDVAPNSLPFIEPPRRDRRIIATAAVSVLLHLGLLGWILLPREQLPPPSEPKSVNVDLVPPSEVSSEAPSSDAPSSAPPSSAEPSSAEPSSSAEPVSSAAESPSSAQQSSAASSGEPSSAEPPASAAASQERPASAAASAEPAPSSAASASEPPGPAPRGRPLVIPVGPTADSSEPVSSIADTSASSEEAPSASEASTETSSVLTASASDAGDGVDRTAASAPSDTTPEDGGPLPPATDLLHAAKRFYLKELLDQPALAKVRKALKDLPRDKRLAQTCNLEAIGQIGNAGKAFAPDALVANAFAKPATTDTSYNVSNGAFRSKEKWYAVAYTCTLNGDLTAVKSFSFHIGDEVTAAMQGRIGG